MQHDADRKLLLTYRVDVSDHASNLRLTRAALCDFVQGLLHEAGAFLVGAEVWLTFGVPRARRRMCSSRTHSFRHRWSWARKHRLPQP